MKPYKPLGKALPVFGADAVITRHISKVLSDETAKRQRDKGLSLIGSIVAEVKILLYLKKGK